MELFLISLASINPVHHAKLDIGRDKLHSRMNPYHYMGLGGSVYETEIAIPPFVDYVNFF